MLGHRRAVPGKNVDMAVMVHPSNRQAAWEPGLLRVRVVPVPPLLPSGSQHHVIVLSDLNEDQRSFWVTCPSGLTLPAPFLLFGSKLLARTHYSLGRPAHLRAPVVSQEALTPEPYVPDGCLPAVLVLDRPPRDLPLYDPCRKSPVEAAFIFGERLTAARRSPTVLTVNDIDNLVLISDGRARATVKRGTSDGQVRS
jgi:hypothetical protein